MGLTDEVLLGITIISVGGRTTVPGQVMEALKLKPTPGKKEKLLWTQVGDEVNVRKGTPQSSFRKTKVNKDGRTAVPKHIRAALKLKTALKDERMLWMQRGDEIFVRKGA